MTLSEFRCWFEGFTEGIDGAPSKAQFAKIKAKVALITSTPTTYPVFIDRWVQPYRHYWHDYWNTTSSGHDNAITYTAGGSLSIQTDTSVLPYNAPMDSAGFDSHAAMRELGRMEAMN